MSMNCEWSCGSRHETIAVYKAQGQISEGSCEQQVVDIVGVERQFDQQQRTVSSVW